MNILPFNCQKCGHKFVQSTIIGDRYSYYCPCGNVILSTALLDYLEPCLDKDGKRAKLVLDMIAEARNHNDLSPYINTAVFDRRLAAQQQEQIWWKRLFSLCRHGT